MTCVNIDPAAIVKAVAGDECFPGDLPSVDGIIRTFYEKGSLVDGFKMVVQNSGLVTARFNGKSGSADRA